MELNRRHWVLIIPAALAVLFAFLGFTNLSSGTGTDLVDLLGNPGASVVAGFTPAVIALGGLLFAFRSPGTGVAATLGLLFLYLGILTTWQGLLSGWNTWALYAAGALGSAAFLVGLGVSRRSPPLGRALVIGSALPMAVIGYWTIVMPIVAVALAVFGVRRAQGLARRPPAS